MGGVCSMHGEKRLELKALVRNSKQETQFLKKLGASRRVWN